MHTIQSTPLSSNYFLLQEMKKKLLEEKSIKRLPIDFPELYGNIFNSLHFNLRHSMEIFSSTVPTVHNY